MKEVPIECHFWDEKTWKDIAKYKREKIVRLRSQTKKIYTDIAFTFDGEEFAEEYPDYKVDIYNV